MFLLMTWWANLFNQITSAVVNAFSLPWLMSPITTTLCVILATLVQLQCLLKISSNGSPTTDSTATFLPRYQLIYDSYSRIIAVVGPKNWRGVSVHKGITQLAIMTSISNSSMVPAWYVNLSHVESYYRFYVIEAVSVLDFFCAWVSLM